MIKRYMYAVGRVNIELQVQRNQDLKNKDYAISNRWDWSFFVLDSSLRGRTFYCFNLNI